MTCPPCTHNCNQGRTCPARKPFGMADPVRDYEKLREQQAKSDLKSILFIASGLLAFWLIVWGTLP